jgi:hypothetical protein
VLFIDKTKYIELLDETERYRYSYRKESGYGKTTFLNMLCSYYDIAQAATFEDVFGGLYICAHPTLSRSRHLVLLLDLTTITTSNEPATIYKSFHSTINPVLENFVKKYWGWIGDGSDIEGMICQHNASTSLMRVLVRIGRANARILFS